MTTYQNDSEVGHLTQRVAEEFHTIHALINGDAHDYDLNALGTADKSSLVAAINEVRGQAIIGGGLIFRQSAPAAQWTIPNGGNRKEPTVVLDGFSEPVETDITFPADTQVTILTFPEPVSGFAYF